MKKSDLREGMIIRTRSEGYFLLHEHASGDLKGQRSDTGKRNIAILNGMRSNLSNMNREYDVLEVLVGISGINSLGSLYRRPVEELTLDQVCRELGRDIKIVRG